MHNEVFFKFFVGVSFFFRSVRNRFLFLFLVIYDNFCAAIKGNFREFRMEFIDNGRYYCESQLMLKL